jgi:hypothetical protein
MHVPISAARMHVPVSAAAQPAPVGPCVDIHMHAMHEAVDDHQCGWPPEMHASEVGPLDACPCHRMHGRALRSWSQPAHLESPERQMHDGLQVRVIRLMVPVWVQGRQSQKKRRSPLRRCTLVARRTAAQMIAAQDPPLVR